MAIKTGLRVGSRSKKEALIPLRIALVQVNSSLGDCENNSKKIIEEIKRSAEKHCNLVVFPEAALFGYHPFDLLERKVAIKKQLQYLRAIHKHVPAGMTVVIGCFTLNSKKLGRPFYNSAAILQKGRKAKFLHKTLLPTGDVFDEARFIQQGDITQNLLTIYKQKVLFTICEDIWAWPDVKGFSPYTENPLMRLKSEKVDLVINLSASPFYLQKMQERYRVTQKTAKLFKAPVIYVNLVGAQDEIIYDGGSFVCSPKGKILAQNIQFAEDLNVFDLSKLEGGQRPLLKGEAHLLRQALVLGLRDYCSKIGIKKVHLGLSGGIDSAVVAALAAEALGPQNVTAIALPGPFNADESLTLAKQLAKNLGVGFIEFPISSTFESLRLQISQIFDFSNDMHLAYENLQARIRGIILMAFSNIQGSMLLATSNKSEMATGYSTLYGDLCGGLAPIGDLTKKQVYLLAEHFNEEIQLIPQRIIDRAPSAELAPNQKDQDSLPPYDSLDSMVIKIIEKAGEIKNSQEKWLFSKITGNEFKRWQAPPILKVSKHSFGRGRRWPIAHKVKD